MRYTEEDFLKEIRDFYKENLNGEIKKINERRNDSIVLEEVTMMLIV